MDLLDLLVLLVECVVVGAGWALGDWLIQHIRSKVADEPETKPKTRRRTTQ